MKKKKVLFISSTGGHLNELLELSPLFEKYDYHIITEKDKTNEYLKEKYGNRLSYLPYGTRSQLFKYIGVYFYLILKTIYYYLKLRPQVIVTTGTHTAGPMCYLGKLCGSKIVYIETLANINKKTVTRKTDLSNCRPIYCAMGGNVKTLSKSSIWWKNFSIKGEKSMEENSVTQHTFLGTIQVKGKKFKIFSDKGHRKNFLKELEDGSLVYPTLEEYNALSKIYNPGLTDKIYFKKFKFGKKYKFTPKVMIEQDLEEPEYTDKEEESQEEKVSKYSAKKIAKVTALLISQGTLARNSTETKLGKWFTSINIKQS